MARIELAGDRIVEVEAGGVSYRFPDAVISSLPLRNVVEMVSPAPPAEVLDGGAGPSLPRLPDRRARRRRRRICSRTTGSTSTSRTCGSAASRTTARGRRGWSPTPTRPASASSTSASPATTSGRWTTTQLVELAARELEQLGLAPRSKVERGFAIRVPKAYPIYDADYAERVATIRTWLDGIENLQQVGRNGLHRYNNSDHSMLTAMRAVDNLLAGAHHDIWEVNAESVYHEADVVDEHPYRSRSRDARDAGARSLPLSSESASPGRDRRRRRRSSSWSPSRRSGGRR